MKGSILTSKTFWGAVLVAAAKVYSNPKDATNIVEAIGGVITVVGARQAIAKNGTGA